MKHIGTSVAVMVVVLAFAAGAAAAPAPSAPPAAMKNPAQMSTEELSKIQLPPSAKLQMKRLSARAVAIPLNFQGPDLVIPEPVGEPGMKYGSSVGFPAAPFPGWLVDWWVKNQGNQAAGPNALKIECDVTVLPPGSPQYNYLKQKWCLGFAPMSGVPALGAGVTKTPPPYKIFIGGPLWPCSVSGYPRPKFTVTVDPSNVVHEKAFGEGNNVHVAEFCLAPL